MSSRTNLGAAIVATPYAAAALGCLCLFLAGPSDQKMGAIVGVAFFVAVPVALACKLRQRNCGDSGDPHFMDRDV